MLEISYGLTFFLKSPKRKSDLFRYVYVRVTVDGVPKETSTKRKWDMRRWDQYLGRAIGTKEDTKSLNFFLGSLEVKISNFKTELVNTTRTITSTRIIEFVKGHETSKTKVLEEFQKYNEEVKALVSDGYAKGTYTRYVTAKKTSGDDLYCTIFLNDGMLKNASEEYVAATIIHELVYTILYYKRIPGDLQHQEMIANQLADMEATMLELFPKMDKYDAHALCYEGLDETIYGGALKKIFPQIWNGMVKINKAHREGTKGTKCK